MAVRHTKKIHICALKEDRKQILEELQRLGAVQIEKDGDEDSVFKRMDTGQARSAFARKRQDAEEALKALEMYAPEKTGLFSSLEGRKTITRAQYEAQTRERDYVLEAISAILEQQKKLGEARTQLHQAESSLESLAPWMGLDVPLDYQGTRTAAAFIGALPGHWTMEGIRSAIAAAHPELAALDVEIVGADRDQTCIFAVCPKIDAEALEDALRTNGFVRPALQSALVPADHAGELELQAKEAKKTEQEAIRMIASYASYREKIRFAADDASMRAEKYRILGELLQSEHVFFLEGYVPENRAKKLQKHLEGTYTCQVRITEVPGEEDAPVLLHNNRFTEPTQSVVEAFGLPHKGEVDPTAVMAFFYYFLFGMMLSDAGYGIVMIIFCLWAVKKFPDMEEGLQKMLRLFFWCGISTTIWGFLFGGFFGDIVTVAAKLYFNRDVTLPALWFAPLEDPMKLLMFSFLFGIIHLFAGLAVKGYMLLRDRDYMGFFAGVFCWYVLLVSLILLLLPSDLFASMAGLTIVLPGDLGPVAKWAAIVSAVCIVLFSETGTRNIAARIALGAYDLYGVSGWLSDVLSYSRLLALGLATGVIGSVINTMASMLGGSPVGKVLFWVVVLAGHALNMSINLLGAYVHTNRLQFVEFFGKFYEGGGRPFVPFSAAKNKYFKFKEEE